VFPEDLEELEDDQSDACKGNEIQQVTYDVFAKIIWGKIPEKKRVNKTHLLLFFFFLLLVSLHSSEYIGQEFKRNVLWVQDLRQNILFILVFCNDGVKK
jgi:hypothetical protein